MYIVYVVFLRPYISFSYNISNETIYTNQPACMCDKAKKKTQEEENAMLKSFLTHNSLIRFSQFFVVARFLTDYNNSNVYMMKIRQHQYIQSFCDMC